jgi:hypothetical protein
MSFPVYGYPQPGKPKSEQILVAFCGGAGGYIVDPSRGLQDPGAAAFYGLAGLEALFTLAKQRAQLHRGDWYYLDNAYFDATRQRYFRVSKNAMQRSARSPDFARLDELDVTIAPWRRAGRSILIVEQSDYFMRELVGWRGGAAGWREDVMRELAGYTDRPLRPRIWLRDKAKASSSLAADLAGAWAVVTHSSAAAVEAVLAGVPVFLTGESVAIEMGLVQLSRIEQPSYPEGRREWAARLAASQWRLDEMTKGVAWRALNESLTEEVKP